MKRKNWLRKLAFAAIAVLLVTVLAGCPILGDESLEEKINRILRDREAESVVPADIGEVRTLLAQNGVSEFVLEEPDSWLFWEKNANRVDIVVVDDILGQRPHKRFSEDYSLTVLDDDGNVWYPLIDYGDPASKLAVSRLDEGSYAQVLPQATGCKAGDLDYYYYRTILQNSVVYSGTYAFGTEDGVVTFATAGEAAVYAKEHSTEAALLGCQDPGAFAGFSTIQEGFVAAGVEDLGAGAFTDCTSLASVILPDDLYSVGAAAFANCASLGNIDLKNVQTLGESAFLASGLREIQLPAGVKTIPLSAFAYCTRLENVVWTDVSEIEEAAFYLCGELVSVSGPAVEAVGKEAFFLCQKLEKFDFVSETAEIGQDAFYGTSFAGKE